MSAAVCEKPCTAFKERVKMTENEARRLMLIDKILKSEPPMNMKDLYHINDFWSKYGGISSGICMKWCWYRSVRELSLEEVEMIYKKLKRSKLK